MRNLFRCGRLDIKTVAEKIFDINFKCNIVITNHSLYANYLCKTFAFTNNGNTRWPHFGEYHQIARFCRIGIKVKRDDLA